MYPCSSRLHFLCFFHHRAPPMKQHKVGNPQQRGRATAKQNNQIQLILFNGLIKEVSVEESGRGGLDANLNLPPIGLTLALQHGKRNRHPLCLQRYIPVTLNQTMS